MIKLKSENQKIVLEALGSDYTVKVIDQEPCIYRKINKNYDIEISGTNRKRHPMSVYVWDITNGEGVAAHIVDRKLDIRTVEELKQTLEGFLSKYQCLT